MDTTPGNADFYTVLGVPRTATAEEIKQAYRLRAKELHPDKNRNKDATAKFQRLQEAYSVLGSPERRKLYDAGSFEAAVDPATKATEADFDPVPCDGCGCISAQPRFVQYDRVISVIFASYRAQPAGVFCPSCASKKLFINSLVTGAVGWLGLWGIIWSIAAIIRNLCGGERAPGINAFILGKQAAYFCQQGKHDLARALAQESVHYHKKSRANDEDYNLGRSGAELAQAIARQLGDPRISLRSRWAGWPVPARYALAGLIVPIVAWGAVFSASESSGRPRAKNDYRNRTTYSNSSSNPAYRPSQPMVPPQEEYVDVRGADGYTYRVSIPDYQRLKPIYDSLESRRPLLEARINRVKNSRDDLERRKRYLDNSDEFSLNTFNHDVDEWNLSNEQLRTNLESFDREIDRYNAELMRVGRRVP